MHPQTRLGYEILPYLRDLDDHGWTAAERKFLDWAEGRKGRPLTEPEKRLWVAQGRVVGDLSSSSESHALNDDILLRQRGVFRST